MAEAQTNGHYKKGKNGNHPLNGTNGSASGAERIRPSGKHSLRQVLVLQEAVYEAGGLLREDIKSASAEDRAKLAGSLATLATSWTRLQDIKQQIQGKGKPMPVPSRQSVKKPIQYAIDEQTNSSTTLNDSPAP